MTERDHFATHVWNFFMEHQQRAEMGEGDAPYPLALEYIKRNLSFTSDKQGVLLKITEECTIAENGGYPNINKGDSLIKQLRLASLELFEGL